ncbi:MAG TPA: N-acetyl-1-D-myo-inositol-2-amino-2-deoxy-alpha-D-glucopyranoside deacetylase [Pseudonocardiaceae bacterium]|nr:N-acetyl-1-D-myo-inositol-2-amino-2-deoxy-alpha-D-glucopyranoside deacetylase [Pseudonocardiaceae bacterium]
MTVTQPRRLALVHAHPDDESLWTGGTIARYAAAGVEVMVITCTLGEEGEIIPPDLAQLRAREADQLGGYRIGELRGALAELGVSRHAFLGGPGRWRDSGMAGDRANEHPRAFAAGPLHHQTGMLVEQLAEFRPQVLVSYDAFGGYGHPDHIRAHEITVAAAALLPEVARVFYAVQSGAAVRGGLAQLSGWDQPFRLPREDDLAVVDDELIDTVIDTAEHVPAKLRALRAHATQVSVWESGERAVYALSNDLAAPVLAKEYFVLASGRPDGADDDLFGGLEGRG